MKNKETNKRVDKIKETTMKTLIKQVKILKITMLYSLVLYCSSTEPNLISTETYSST